MNDELALRAEERISARLRAMYAAWGYRPWKVSRFEAYDLYSENKRFLSDERVLAFTDTDGKLLALKPDVTLSVVKNAREEELPLRVFYAESVYRVPRGGMGFREIMQTGVESIGVRGTWGACEVLLLAAKSLQLIRPDGWQLDVSDMGIIGSVLSREVLTGAERAALLRQVSGKNLHGLSESCAAFGVSWETAALLERLVASAGPLTEAVTAVEALPLPGECAPMTGALREMGEAAEALGLTRVCLDFSVVNDMSYYNGLVFSGFVQGVPSAVLSGGRYDPLMERTGKRGGAIGFAVNLDLAARLSGEDGEQAEPVRVPTANRTAREIALAMEACASRGQRALAEEAEE